MLLANKDIDKLREPIVFWAYDDTIQPGNSYHYRLRLGVFNPVAGMGQAREEDSQYEDKVILWGEFSEPTEKVDIPHRLYFFPVNVQETAQAVDVQVCKYTLGYWYSEQFMVKRGDVIGRPAAVKAEPNSEAILPEKIDYTTGAMLIDVVPVNDWAGDKKLQQRHYFDMLYSFDGTEIARTAAKLLYWPEELRIKYTEIKALEKKPRQPFKQWSSSGAFGGIRRALPGIPTRTPTDRREQPAGEPGMDTYMKMMMQQQ
jgi:hypothetical protein